MSQAVHVIAKNLPGYRQSEGRCLPCLSLSGRAVVVSPRSLSGDFRIRSQVRLGSVECGGSKGASFVCRANSGAYRRNPDFSRQSKNGYRGRNRQNEERDSIDDESDLLSSKNGPILSLSNSPKFQATSAPGPREKEIVQLFRKVQAQLRERATAREDKKIEAVQGERKESETVDSLLKLLRKHSVEQSKRKISSGSDNDFNLEQTEPNGSYVEEKHTSFFDSSSRAKTESRESSSSSFTRPASNFRRRSPVSQFKYQPVSSNEETLNSISHKDSSGRGKKMPVEIRIDPQYEPEPQPESDASFADIAVYDEASDVESNVLDGTLYDEVLESEHSIVDDNVDTVSVEGESSVDDEDEEKQEEIEDRDLTAWKLPELRALAKSRGVKGFSKMKKADLLELLTGGSA